MTTPSPAAAHVASNPSMTSRKKGFRMLRMRRPTAPERPVRSATAEVDGT
ncbi:hypothetical protein [Clavibacter zhangzhiyongii]